MTLVSDTRPLAAHGVNPLFTKNDCIQVESDDQEESLLIPIREERHKAIDRLSRELQDPNMRGAQGAQLRQQKLQDLADTIGIDKIAICSDEDDLHEELNTYLLTK